STPSPAPLLGPKGDRPESRSRDSTRDGGRALGGRRSPAVASRRDPTRRPARARVVLGPAARARLLAIPGRSAARYATARGRYGSRPAPPRAPRIPGLGGVPMRARGVNPP